MPTINKGSDYFGVLTYTGDGAASKTVVDTSAVTFQPDFVWIKGRSGATDHALYDAVRGTTKDLVSNSTAAETTQSTGLTSFVNGGFTISKLAKLNTSGATYTAWCWKANGAGSSNTQGTITSTVSVNTTAGFSIATYTGTGANATVGHGLGVTPKMTIIKKRSATGNWIVGHIGATNWNWYLTLNSTAVQTGDATMIRAQPDINVVYLGTNTDVNASSATFVMYNWAEIAGFSKFGSYTGNGSTDGPFIYTGFRPKWLMIKVTNAVNEWIIVDSSRNTYNVIGNYLLASSPGAEGSATVIDFVSNGFKLRNNYNGWNGSGENIIYAAFAENPFK